MSRPVNPNSMYTIKPHVLNDVVYASTQPPYIDPETGKKKYRYVHWGKIVNNRFLPMQAFFLASPEERKKLIFPEGMDLSEAAKLSGEKTKGHIPYQGEDRNRFYGDVWLLEKIAERTGVRADLMKVFEGNKELVDDILTMAYFPYLTGYSYNRLSRWQRIAKTPSDRDLTSTWITRLTQSITEHHRMDLLKLRAARLGKGALCAVDSTTRSAYGSSLTDIRWGKNKEALPLRNTIEVVVYSLDTHVPIYYRSFPGNFPDSRSIETILLDLSHAGFKNITLVTDRGYESIQNLERYILKGQKMVMAVKTCQGEVYKRIKDFGVFDARPDEMIIDSETSIYYTQKDLVYRVNGNGNSYAASNKLKLNIYLDSIKRSAQLMDIDASILTQRQELETIKASAESIDDDETIRRKYRYFKIDYDKQTRKIINFTLDEKKLSKSRMVAGFFASMTHGVNYSAMEAFHVYKLRDEQEKYFEQMKNQMGADRQRTWSEEGKEGRRFVLFIGQIISSYLRHIWKSTNLHKSFSSSIEILDEMRPIRYIEQAHKKAHITPFVGKQIEICKSFDFDLPLGCAPNYISKERVTKKRGRQPKPKIKSLFIV